MKKTYKFSYYLAGIVLATCLIGSASAVTTNYWSGAGDGTTWSQSANWVGGAVPVAGNVWQIYLGTGYPTATPTPITIGAADVVTAQDQLFGPEWGESLNIYGSVNTGFGFAPVGDAANPSVVNMYSGSSLTTGDSIFLGDMFWFNGGPYLTVNMYGNSQMTTSYLAVGGHLNIFGGTVTANTALLTGTSTAGAWGSPIVTDATRLIDVAGGQLIVAGDATAQAADLITRGVLEGNGIVGNVNIDITSMAGYTIITAVPEPATMALLGLSGLALILRRRLVS
jgi:hypothetical protein